MVWDLPIIRFAAACGLVLSLGCSPEGHTSSDQNAPLSQIAQARDSAEKPTTATHNRNDVHKSNGGGEEFPESVGPEDSDEPTASAFPARSPTVLLDSPFSPVFGSDAPSSEQRELERKGRQDDPEAAVILVEQQHESPPDGKRALNNGRDGAVRPPSRSASAPSNPNSGTGDGDSRPAAETAVTKPTTPQHNASSDAATAKLGASSRRKSGDVRSESAGQSSRQAHKNLPAEYRSLDKDQDGQIGLYEWPRENLADFRQLDRNQDGFLTPRELSDAKWTTR
jgi:hypothetical protein